MINYKALINCIELDDKYIGKEAKYIDRAISGTERFITSIFSPKKSIHDRTGEFKDQPGYNPKVFDFYTCYWTSYGNRNDYRFYYDFDSNAVIIEHENYQSEYNYCFITEDNKYEVKALIDKLLKEYLVDHYNYRQKNYEPIEEDLESMLHMFNKLVRTMREIRVNGTWDYKFS